MARAPVSESAPEHAAHEEVAETVLGAVLVDHEADQEAVLEQEPLRQRELLDHLLHALERRPAGQLEHEVALGGRDHHLGPDRPRTLRDDRGHRQALQHDADGALLGAAAVREQPRGAVTRRGPRSRPARARRRARR